MSMVRKQFLGSSKRAAEQAYEKWKEEQRLKKDGLINDGRTFKEVADYYRDNVLAINSKYSPGTRDRYIRSYNNHIRDYSDLTAKTIADIKAEDIQVMYNSLNVSKSTLEGINKFMVGFFKWSLRNGYTENLMEAIIMPEKKDNKRTEEGEIIIWEDEELKTIISNLGTYRLRFLVILALNSGLRISELLGLKYADFEDGILHVRRQYCDGDFRPPKNNSVRDVPINESTLHEFEKHKEWHQKEMKKNRYKTDHVFTTNSGRLLDRANVRRSLDRYYNKIGVDHKKFHAYRATFCTNLCKAGVYIQTASKLMGHKSVEVTSKFYTSVSQSEKVDAVNLLPTYNI